MKRKAMKALALAVALLMLAGLAFSEELLDGYDGELQLGAPEDAEAIDIDGGAMDEMVIALDDLDLALDAETVAPVATAIYRFIVDGAEYAVQEAQEGEAILRPEDPAAPDGKVFVGWVLSDGTRLFADADDGESAPVIVGEAELGTEIYVWAEFADIVEEEPEAEQPAEEEPAEEEPAEEEPAEEEPAEEEPADEEPAEEEPAAEEPTQEEPTDEEPAEEEPAEEEPAEEEPAEEEPAAEEPADEEPADEEPEAEEPTEDEPAVESAEEEQPEAQVVEEQPEADEPAVEPLAEEILEEKPVANALTYSGEAQALLDAQGAWLYSLDGEDYSEEIPTAVDAGEYTVYFKAAEDAEPETLTVTVAKADVTFTPPVAASVAD